MILAKWTSAKLSQRLVFVAISLDVGPALMASEVQILSLLISEEIPMYCQNITQMKGMQREL